MLEGCAEAHPRRINPTVIKRRRTTSMTPAAFLIAIAAGTTPSPLRLGQTFLAEVADPAKGSNGWSLVSHGVGVRDDGAEVGDAGVTYRRVHRA